MSVSDNDNNMINDVAVDYAYVTSIDEPTPEAIFDRSLGLWKVPIKKAIIKVCGEDKDIKIYHREKSTDLESDETV